MNGETIGLENEQRSDFELREIFVEAYKLVEQYLAPNGSWLSMADESFALEALTKRFPDITGMRLFGVLGTIAGVRASGRNVVD